MKEIEAKLREGMDRNGIRGEVQDQIMLTPSACISVGR